MENALGSSIYSTKADSLKKKIWSTIGPEFLQLKQLLKSYPKMFNYTSTHFKNK